LAKKNLGDKRLPLLAAICQFPCKTTVRLVRPLFFEIEACP
jgi:hypothetical protein